MFFSHISSQTSKYQAQSSQGEIVGHDKQDGKALAAPPDTSSKSLSDAVESFERALVSIGDGLRHLVEATSFLTAATNSLAKAHDPMRCS